jgi:hypothetical protein
MVAQNRPIGINFELSILGFFSGRIFRYEGKVAAVQPIFFSQEIFVRRSKIKFRFFLVGFSRRF